MAESPSDDNRDMWRAYNPDGTPRWPSIPPAPAFYNPAVALAEDIARWMADGSGDLEVQMFYAYDLVRTLQAKGWQFQAPS